MSEAKGSEQTAKLVLEDVKRHIKYDGPIEIGPLDVLPVEFRHSYQNLSSIAGTHQNLDGISIVLYNPEQMRNPIQFINLLAHEVKHARLAGQENEVPGGELAHELATNGLHHCRLWCVLVASRR